MGIKNIDAKTLEKWLKNDEAVLVDVREIAEHQARNIAKANLVPLGKICCGKLPNFSGKKLVVHCQGGKRSLAACQKLIAEDGDLEVYNLEGGINAWLASGCDCAGLNKFFLPLDRQVQLVIGLNVFLGSVLGYFVNPAFFLLSGFFGAGLIFASLTGTCALAALIAKMPWNCSSKTVTNFCSTK